MKAHAHAELHHDFQRWLSDQALWNDEIKLWEDEITASLAQVWRLSHALHRQRRDLRKHAQRIQQGVRALEGYEHLLAEYERGHTEGKDLDLLRLSQQHEEHERNHNEQREAHEQMKHRQRAMIAQLTQLRDVPVPAVW